MPIHRNVSELRPHPALRHMWELPPDDPRFQRIVDSIAQSGILESLKVTEAGEIVDGRHRWRAAKRLKLESVPVDVVGEDRVAEIAMETRMARRHLLSKSQLAYETYPLFARRHQELRAANAAMLQRGPEGVAQPERPLGTVEDLARQLGIGSEVFRQAARLHQLFVLRPELREEWEPRIMRDEEPVALGAALAGIAGGEKTRGVTPVPVHRNSSLHRWDNSWTVLGRETKAWGRWTVEEQEHALAKVRETIEVLPEPVLDAVTNALRAVRRARAGGMDGAQQE